MRSSRPIAVVAAVVVAACGHAPAPVAALAPAASAPTAGPPVSSGAADALAAELLFAGAPPAPLPWHALARPVADPALAQALDALAVDHLRSSALGAGTGPLLVGSTAVAALAAAPGAPPDQNGNGTNRDEALAAECERIAAYAGATAPPHAAPPLLPWRQRSAELAEPLPAARPDAPPWRTPDPDDRTLAMADAGAFLRVRALAARRLLLPRHRDRYGASAEDGVLGLLLMQQLLAAETELFARLFTDGTLLAPLDPDGYDPAQGARWLPHELQAEPDPALPGAASAFRTADAASDLNGLAAMLRGACELIDATDPAVPQALPELFRGRPFRPPPRTPVAPSITWTWDIRPLMVQRCGNCHLNQSLGGFSIATYASMRLGGNKTRQLGLPFVVPGNPAQSVLHQILVGPPAPFVRMPFGAPPLPAAQIARVDAWIAGGALEHPPAVPPPPRPGEDLARVSFQNLVALHLDAPSGALHHRAEADGPSRIATALATGHALAALADLDRVASALAYGGFTPQTLLAHAAAAAGDLLVDGTGACADHFDLATGSRGGSADLRAQAALCAGLLAAAARLPPGHAAAGLGARTANRLLDAFGDPAGRFGDGPGLPPGSLAADTLADLLAALRLAAAGPAPAAETARAALLATLRPALAFAEWPGHGEVLGDGLPDTDGDGLREPAAAGGAFGRLPLLAGRVIAGPGAAADREPTWSEHVRPLLLAKCGECHGNGNQQGGYRLDTRALLATAGASQGGFPLLVPGEPAASLLFQKITSRRPPFGAPMPLQRAPLDPAAQALIERWIRTGARAR